MSRRRSCNCNKWGCVTCMQRYVHNYYHGRMEHAPKTPKPARARILASPNGRYKVYLPDASKKD